MRKDLQERRIVLLGKTGVGKSATGNTILGDTKFPSSCSIKSVTKVCSSQKAVVDKFRVNVVDTPGFFDTDMPPDKLAKEIGRSVYLSAPGVHAFVLVFPYGRFSVQEEEVFEKVKKVFGEHVRKHMIILFTYGDEVNEEDSEAGSECLRRVLEQCGNRYHVINNKDQSNREQVIELLNKIDQILEQNEGNCYTNELLEDAYRSSWEKFWKKYKKPLICAALIFGGVVLSGGVGAGVGYLIKGKVGAVIGAGVGVLGAYIASTKETETNPNPSPNPNLNLSSGNEAGVVASGAVVGAAACGVARALGHGLAGAPAGVVGGAILGVELAATTLLMKKMMKEKLV